MPLAGAVQTGRAAAAKFSNTYGQLRAKPEQSRDLFWFVKIVLKITCCLTIY
jgi:hypothetical protein